MQEAATLTPEEVREIVEAVVGLICVCGAYKIMRAAFF